MRLPVASVHEDPEVQLRDGLDMDRVIGMVEFEELGGHLPPITVVGDDNLLGDGHHRLAAARRAGKLEIDAERVEGGKDEAIVVAMQRNLDLGHLSVPLSRQERNRGVKMLLRARWTNERIAKATGVHAHTIGNISDALAMRGEVKKRPASVKGGPTPRQVAVLPKAVADAITSDTVLVRIAALDTVAQQQEMAAAVAASGISEPRVREAVRAVKATGVRPVDAVADVTPAGRAMPVSFAEVAKQSRRRIERFTSEPMMIEGVERDFWQVLDVLASVSESIPLEAKSLARLLADVAVKADHYATALRSSEAIEATA